MGNLTLLTNDNIEGVNALDLIKKFGMEAEITDFSLATGCEHVRTSPKNKLNKIGHYWINSSKPNEKFGYVAYMHGNAIVPKKNFGIRPVIDIKRLGGIIPRNPDSDFSKDKYGFLEVEYGHYPQTVVNKYETIRLDEAFNKNSLIETGNEYTIDEGYQAFKQFKRSKIKEYIFENTRYVRVPIQIDYPSSNINVRLSNDVQYSAGDYVWIKVEPVKWHVDLASGKMVSDKILCTCREYAKDETFKDFSETEIKKYLDNILKKEMLQECKVVDKKEDETENKNESKKEEKYVLESYVRNSTNPYKFDFSKLTEMEIIKGALKADVSIFLHGKPGCGKSARIKQLDPDFVELNLSHLDPELLDGIAGEKDGKAIHIKPPWLDEIEEKAKSEPNKIHILFLDELTNASPMMQSKAYGIALEKKVAGRWKLPENVRVVAAGNEVSDSLAANEMAEPLYKRFAHVNIKTNSESWLKWAMENNDSYEKLDYEKIDKKSRPKIHPAILAYISIKRDGALETRFDLGNPTPHADPRRWEMASEMLYATNNPDCLNAVVGEKVTKDFIAFCRTPLIDIDDIINENYGEQDVKMDLNKKLLTVFSLVIVDEKNVKAVRDFVKKLGPEFCRKFDVLWTSNNPERLEILQELKMIERQERMQRKKSTNKHTGNAARCMCRKGIINFSEINNRYQRFLQKTKMNLQEPELKIG